MRLTEKKITTFQETIWQYYYTSGRPFAWRNVDDPYKILVSEVMLQQTQTSRVINKFEQWIAEFPTFQSLASASLRDVLSVWAGLGYNRRGMYLQQCAQRVVDHYAGTLPDSSDELILFPGIGKATAASICAFAFNQPTVFIETNIRAVFIHCFFNNRTDVHDKEIMPLIAQTVDCENPREWYYALMDYGVLLKKLVPNPSRKSKHHTRQTAFEGSDRQIRGMIVRALTEHTWLPISSLIKQLGKDEARCKIIIEKMCTDGLLRMHDHRLMIS